MTCLLILGWKSHASGSNFDSQVGLLKYEINKLDKINNKEESELKKRMIESNIEYISGSIKLKIRRLEENLEKIKIKIQNYNNFNDNNGESMNVINERLWKKFSSTQKKIESLNDLLFVIDQCKSRLKEF